MTGHHRAAKRPGGPRRVLSALMAVLGAVVLLGSVQGTFAFWSDEASMSTGSLTAGTLDVTLDGNLAGRANDGGTWTQTTFALDAMLPGESRATSFAVRNAGTSGLTYAVAGSATGALAPALRFSVYAGGAAANTGTAAAGNRAGSCAGAAVATDVTLAAASAVLTATRRTLASGASEQVCVIARLTLDAANGMQGATATATFAFNGRQVGI